MGGFRSNTASAIIAASVLAYQTTGAHASQHLRHHRSLQTNDDSVSSGDYEHVGCFKDSRHDRILGAKLTNDEVNAEFCYKYCNDLGAPLMATQWGKECWCATHVEVDFGRHGEAVCDFPCAGNKDGEDEMCGGFDALDLYIIGSHSSSSEDDDDAEDTASPTGSPTASPTATPTSPALPSEPETIPEDDAMEDDIVKIIPVTGANPAKSWADSYSVGDTCYMHSNLDHGIADKVVDTPLGSMTISELYALMGSGPGPDGHPLYNDIQCGNGPPNDWADETQCPGLVEHGPEGCGQIGPMWDLSELAEDDTPLPTPTPPTPDEAEDTPSPTPTPPTPSPTPTPPTTPSPTPTPPTPSPTPTPPEPTAPMPSPTSEPETIPEDDAMEDDIVKIIPVTGANPAKSWADSYSVGDTCYMHSNLDHGIADKVVDTPLGSMTISELYALMGSGPGPDGHPLYNDIQCGNGPPNDWADETQCPGLVEHGPEGCGQIGPMWDLSELSEAEEDEVAEDTSTPAAPSSPPPPSAPKTSPPEGAMEDDIVKIIEVTGNHAPGHWADSYSVGDSCWIYSNFDHGVADFIVETPIGSMTISELYVLMGPGPGHEGRPLYNDIQCGNGPPNSMADETQCPGLLDHGPEGCGQIGPKWNLSEL